MSDNNNKKNNNIFTYGIMAIIKQLNKYQNIIYLKIYSNNKTRLRVWSESIDAGASLPCIEID